MQRWIRLILRNRTLVIAILVAVTALAIWICSHAVIATSLARLFLGESPAYERYLELTGEFGSDEVVIVAFESSDLLASGEIERIRSAIERVEEIEEVGSVESIVSAQEVTAEDGALRGEIQCQVPTVDVVKNLRAVKHDLDVVVGAGVGADLSAGY